MSGGTVHPDGPRSQQCEHCLLYFSPQGISNHESSCNWKHVDVHEFAARVLKDTETEESVGVEPVDGSPDAESADGEVSGASVEDAPDTSGGDEADTRADGSGLGLDGPPEAPADDGDEPDGDRDELDCTECGTSTGYTNEELREANDGEPVYLTCEECGHRMRWSA